MTSRKFYGSHFHSLVVHFPEMYRIFCLRSLIPEAEERTFGDLRNISLRTTNRQAKYIVDNCMLRLKAREKIDDDDRLDSFKRQESIISKQAHLLPQRGNTIIPAQIVTTRSTLIQAHYERISDFLVCGKHVWWQVNDGVISSSEGSSNSDLTVNEQLFSSYYNTTCLDSIQSLLNNLLTTEINSYEIDHSMPIKPFIALLIKPRATLYTRKSKEPTSISETDQSILYYLSGYIISALKKESAQVLNTRKCLNNYQNLSAKTTSTKTFVTKYSKWTEKLNRGGLKVPSDNFFLLVREFENIYRKCVNLNCISANSLDIVTLTKTILDNYMTNYYWDQLCTTPDYN
ncbi:unnamed protein product [Mytilus edulis]|uniref:Uncharacterized protein n=1 Tax=Mytilus edulis TaxID=6550 RepID=A0A8S3SKD2_MYTED|nr:unnamed protein product [Mytilus edulis]